MEREKEYDIKELAEIFYDLAITGIALNIALCELEPIEKPIEVEGILIQTPQGFLYYKSSKEYLMIKKKKIWR